MQARGLQSPLPAGYAIAMANNGAGDRIQTLMRDFEKAAKELATGLRKRASDAGIPSDVEDALRQVVGGLAPLLEQVERGVRELRVFLEKQSRSSSSRRRTTSRRSVRKTAARKAPAAKKAKKKAASKAPTTRRKVASKASARKAGAAKAPARKKTTRRR